MAASDRRTFIGCAAAFFLQLAVASCSPRPSSKPSARVASVTTHVPGRIFFPTAPPGTMSQVAVEGLSDDGDGVLVMISNDRTLHLKSRAAALQLVESSHCRCFTREAVLIKSLVAWVLDALWLSLRNRRDLETYPELRQSFGAFQRQAVLGAVTPLALHNLVRDTALCERVRSVRWDGESLRFEVE